MGFASWLGDSDSENFQGVVLQISGAQYLRNQGREEKKREEGEGALKTVGQQN